jgi:hypothetical protein
MALTKEAIKQQSTNVRQQRWRAITAGKRRGAVVEAEDGHHLSRLIHQNLVGE